MRAKLIQFLEDLVKGRMVEFMDMRGGRGNIYLGDGIHITFSGWVVVSAPGCEFSIYYKPEEEE